MTTKTFTVTVSNPGSGNKYYLDSVLTPTISLAKGATYKFDQSDASNNTHPLVFSSDSGNSTPYTDGVTTSGTPGQSGAFTQIVVANTAPSSIYYYCSNHAGMGGQANITSDTWGALEWGQGSWAAQGDVGLTATGSLATFSIGNITIDADIQVGWGGDTWGENEWGDLSGTNPILAGQQLTSSIGSVSESIVAEGSVDVTGIQLAFATPTSVGGTSVDLTLTGLELTSAMGEETIGIGANVTGSQATTTAGSVTIDPTFLIGSGWGRDTWGNLGWGVNYSALAQMSALTSTINFPAANAFTDVEVSVSAPALTMTYANPSFSIISDVGITVLASEDQLDSEVGSIASVVGNTNIQLTGIQATMSIGTTVGGLKTPVDVTGIQATMSLGTTALVQTTVEQPTGIQATMSLGQTEDIPGQNQGVAGQQLLSLIGQATVTGIANVTVSGIELTSSAGSTNITAWSEVDPGVNNVWSEVDLAA